MQYKLLQSYVIKRSQPKKDAYEVKPLAMQCNFNHGGTPLWLCFYNSTCVYAVQVQMLINGYNFQSMAYTQCYVAKRTVKIYTYGIQ